MELRLDRGQRDHEDGEGDVEGEQSRQQRDEGPPLVAGTADGPVRDAPVQQDEPVGLDGSVRPHRPHGAATGVELGVEEDVGLLVPGFFHPGHPRCQA